MLVTGHEPYILVMKIANHTNNTVGIIGLLTVFPAVRKSQRDRSKMALKVKTSNCVIMNHFTLCVLWSAAKLCPQYVLVFGYYYSLPPFGLPFPT